MYFVTFSVFCKIRLSKVIKFCTRKMIKKRLFMSPCKIIIWFVSGCGGKSFLIKCELFFEMSPRIIRTRFQDPLQFLWLIRHSWSPKITYFLGSKKVLYVRKIKPFIHTYITYIHTYVHTYTHTYIHIFSRNISFLSLQLLSGLVLIQSSQFLQ